MNFIRFPDIEAPAIIFRSVREIMRSHVFSSALGSSSCLSAILETNCENEALDMIYMLNDFRADKKRLLLLLPTFNVNSLKNISTNFEVRVVSQKEGNTYYK